MFKNYLKITLRNMWRNKLYSLINILGITIGLTVSCLLFLYVYHELSFDSLHTGSDRVYRVVETFQRPGTPARIFGQTSPAVASTLMAEFPEVEDAVRLTKPGGHVDFFLGDERHHERRWFIADKNFFDMFNGFRFLYGSPETALATPKTLAISESKAMKYWGRTDVVGEQIRISLINEELTVSAVFEDIPHDSHLSFDILFSMEENGQPLGAPDDFDQQWSRFGSFTYFRLREGASIEDMAPRVDALAHERGGEAWEPRTFGYQAIRDAHFQSDDIEFGAESFVPVAKGNIMNVYIYAAIAVFILLIASINYMNLATARSMQRAREIGMRKVTGAHRSQLVFQFLAESNLIVFTGFLLSVGLVDLLLPAFNAVIDRNYVFSAETAGPILLFLGLTTLVVGLASGSYPALIMSKMKPASILKGKMETSRSGLILRKGLVITQFALSVLMIASTMIISDQIDFVRGRNLGFNQEQLLVIDINDRNTRENFEAMKTEFKNHPDVFDVTAVSRVPGEWKSISETYLRHIGGESQDSVPSYHMNFDESALGVFEMEMTTGAYFTGNIGVDSSKVILNETAVRLLGLESPVGSQVNIGLPDRPFTVAGVVKDFHFQSLHDEVQPLIIGAWNNPITAVDYFILKIDGTRMQEAIAHATTVHNQFDQRTAMEFHFLDDQLDRFYQDDQRTGRVFAVGAGLTIFIACMGLFGLAAYMIGRRTKEIGVRKVLGASSISLFLLLAKSFVMQIVIALAIATPLAIFAMNQWLSFFAYRVDIGADVFVITAVATIGIALISISYRAVKAALINPVDSLRAE